MLSRAVVTPLSYVNIPVVHHTCYHEACLCPLRFQERCERISKNVKRCCVVVLGWMSPRRNEVIWATVKKKQKKMPYNGFDVQGRFSFLPHTDVTTAFFFTLTGKNDEILSEMTALPTGGRVAKRIQK